MLDVDFDLFDATLQRMRRDYDEDQFDADTNKAELIRDSFFPEQLAYHTDPHPFRALLTPRQSGKSTVGIGDLVITCLEKPGAACMYITPTRTQGKRIVWLDLQILSKKYKLGCEFLRNELMMIFPNGSWIQIGGALTEDDIQRYRGIRLDKVLIDEAGIFDADLLSLLIRDALGPTLWAKRGQLTLAGTPGVVLAGLWHDTSHTPAFQVRDTKLGEAVTSRPYNERNHPTKWKGVRFQWSFHGWSMEHNVAAPWIWEQALERHILSGDSDEDPTWLREGKGIWVEDLSAFVYKYVGHRNDWEATGKGPFGLPDGHKWVFGMGIDLGYDDDFDIEVTAWSSTAKEFYHVDGFASPGLTISQQAQIIKEYLKRYNPVFVVGDTLGLGKAIFAELAEKHGIVVTPAKHSEKRDYIEITNSELLASRARILKNSNLARQMRNLQWEDPRTKKREHPKMPNHACDAWLYQVRHSLHLFGRERGPAGPEKGTEEWWALREAEEIAAEEREEEQKKSKFYRQRRRLEERAQQFDEWSARRYAERARREAGKNA